MPAPGDFTIVSDASERAMLEDMYRAVSATNTWEEIKADPGSGGFMFSRNAQALGARIAAALTENNHSGASFAFCLRTMHAIANNGWESWITTRLAALKCNT
jgi:hypothetical protein